MERVQSYDFYKRWTGHDVDHLATLLKSLRDRKDSIVFLVGDSSLDNKAWINEHGDATNGYEDVLSPPRVKLDVAAQLNRMMVGTDAAALNCAVEASRLTERTPTLLDQDAFVRDNITENDVLVVSVGANDVVARPSPAMIVAMFLLMVLPCWLSCLFAPFVRLFRDDVQRYVELLIMIRKPRLVIVCGIYYPKVGGRGWADTALSWLRYDTNPHKLQAAIRRVYALATTKIELWTRFEPLALFEVLDPHDAESYVAGVEPSVRGGELIAHAILNIVAPSIKSV